MQPTLDIMIFCSTVSTHTEKASDKNEKNRTHRVRKVWKNTAPDVPESLAANMAIPAHFTTVYAHPSSGAVILRRVPAAGTLPAG